jgi:hypothetical protein
MCQGESSRVVSSPPFPQTDPGRPTHDVAAPGPFVGWPGRTHPGELHQDRVVGSRGLYSCALTSDSLGKRPPTALCSVTCPWFAEHSVCTCLHQRSLETTCEERRAHVGIDTQHQWSDLASNRTTPMRFGLSSLVLLCEQARHPGRGMSVAHCPLP